MVFKYLAEHYYHFDQYCEDLKNNKIEIKSVETITASNSSFSSIGNTEHEE